MKFCVPVLLLFPCLAVAQHGVAPATKPPAAAVQDTNVYSHWPIVQQQPYDTAQMDRACRRLLDAILPLPAPFNIWRPELMGVPQGPEIDTWMRNAEKNWGNGARTEAEGIIRNLERQDQGDARQRLRLRCLPAYLHLNRYEIAEAATLFDQIATPEQRAQGEVQLLEATLQFRRAELNAAFKTASLALQTAQKTKDQELEMRAQDLLGRVARDVFMGASLKAVPFHKASLAIALQRGDTLRILGNLLCLADNYAQAGENQQFINYADQLLNYLSLCPQLDTRGRAALLMALYGPGASRTVFFEKSLRVFQQLNIPSLVQHCYLQLLSCYLFPAQVDRAAALLDSAQLIGQPLPPHELEEYYYQIEKIRGHTGLAFQHLEKAYRAVGEDYMKRSGEQLAEWETRLRTRETELQLERQKRQGWLLFGLLLAFGGLLAGALLAYWNQRRARRKISAQTELIENQAAALRRLDEAKSRFFANVSHELRTPLTLMLGPLGTLVKGGRLEHRDLLLAQTAQNHAKQLLGLVNEILDLSKVESGKMKVQETTVSLQPFLRRLVSAFESHAERLGIRFVFDYRVPERLRLQLDEDKLQKIVNNLLSNALKFTPPQAQGEVCVRVEEFDNRIRLSVHDNGRGIHPDDLPHIFDRFYQTSQLNAPVEGGTGIGLALCREFAELMEGQVWVESEPGDGSHFYFEFPRKEVLGAAVPASEGLADEPEWAGEGLDTLVPSGSGLPAGRHRPVILLVEDNDSLRDYVKLILSEKYQVFTAENGQAALHWLSSSENDTPSPVHRLPSTVHRLPDLILSDVMMPVMDGFQFVERLKSSDQWRHVPVVMLTARADLRDKLKALRIGVDDYLLKPFEEEELLVRLDNLLQHAVSRHAAKGKRPAASAAPATESAAAAVLQTAEEQAWLETLETTVAREIGNAGFNADTLADALFMSRTKFYQQVKRLAGMTPNEYVQEVRFNTARALLETRRSSSVKAAAAAVGFRDVEYFSKQFRARFGKAPSEYLV